MNMPLCYWSEVSDIFAYVGKNISLKIFSLSLLLFLSVDSYAQNADLKNAEGLWVFDNLEFITYKQGESAPLEKKLVVDIKDFENETLPVGVVFQSIEIYNGKMSCLLAGDEYRNTFYRLEDGQLILSGNVPKQKTEDKEQKMFQAPLSDPPGSLVLPNYTYSLTGGKLQFTLKYNFGSSKYSYPLEGEIIMLFKKQ